MQKIGALYLASRRRLAAGLEGADMAESASLDVRRLMEHAYGVRGQDVILNPDMLVDGALLEPLLLKRLAGMPVSRIVGVREFYGLEFDINEDVLDPRPDTEILVERVLRDLAAVKSPRVLDVCTGSGCIGITILDALVNASGVLSDISDKALVMARRNAEKHGVLGRVEFKQTSYVDGVVGRFDAFVCNPPYICSKEIASLEKEVREHDPLLALDGGEDGLFPYKEIFPQIRSLLTTQGKAYFEMGETQASDLRKIADECGLEVHDVLRDFGGRERVIILS